MSTIKINGKTYETDKLSDQTKAQLASLQFVDTEIAKTKALLAALQTARNSYAQSINNLLDASEPGEGDELDSLGDNLSFD